ncbi:hypothetical protein [Martelella limonii]|uniref:hypothetical protein n=1 Tax=Martelella limonii TaxID=1647649 RepID=UPI00158109E2|nr:hypothetical protein [Martelella limonii]
MNDTEKMIEAAKTKSGGWSKETLASWGVPWPPPKGWKVALIRRDALSGKEKS